MWHLSFVSNRLVLEYQTNTSTLANKVKVLFCFIGKFYLCNGEIDFLIILARSYIKPIVADLFEMFFWYVLNNERFSEDIDLILDWRKIINDEVNPWEERSKTKQY